MDGSMGGSMGSGGMEGGGGRRGGRMGGDMGGMMRPGPTALKPIKREKLDKPVTEMFRAADTDRDGFITLGELQAVLAARRDAIIRARFDRIDANHSKTIEPQEFITWQAGLGSAASSESEAMGDNGPIPESIGPELGKSDEDRILRLLIEPLNSVVIANANVNYDRGVSLDELLTHERKRFDAADADKDGWLTPEEIRSLSPRGRGGFGRGGPGTMDGPPAPPDGEGPQRPAQ
ncbi:hypothetical protein BH10PSE13_BH10PSE13_17230 [soil metagenome]